MFQVLMMYAPDCPYDKEVNTGWSEPEPLLTKLYD